MRPGPPAGVLVIRRDNIGDLVCTTPLIAALRVRFPAARIAALVNTYNRDALDHNPHLDAVYAYGKAKHRGERESLAGAWFGRVGLMRALRRECFDTAILAAPGFQPRSLRLAKWAGVRHVVGFTQGMARAERAIDIAVPYGPPAARHEVEDVFRLLAPLGVSGAPGSLVVVPDAALLAGVRARLAAILPGEGPVIGVHLSARKPSQRWPAERFASLIRLLCERQGARIVLLWAPGSERNPRHPGDDEKARALADACDGLPLHALPTLRLAELIAALAACDAAVLSDGGAMHLAAALGKPLVCLFGDSSPERWRPWQVRHTLLQHPSRDVSSIQAAEAVAALAGLLAGAG